LKVSALPAIRFSSEIHLLSKGEFERQVPMQDMVQHPTRQYAEDPWTPKEAVRHEPRGFTLDTYDCSIVGLTMPTLTEKGLSLFHLAPDAGTVAGSRNAVRTEIYSFTHLANPFRALLMGGQSPFEASDSANLGNALMEELNTQKVPTSVLWGQRGGTLDAYYDAQSDRWLLRAERFIKDSVTNTTRFPTTRSLRDLKEHFANIYIAPGDQLFIKGKPVAAEDANQWLSEELPRPQYKDPKAPGMPDDVSPKLAS
jgi:hypothetical protein